MRDFPDGPMVVKTSCFQCRGKSSIPDRGTKTYMPWGVTKKKKKKPVMKDLIVLLFFKIVSGILYYLHLGSFAIFYKKKKIIIINKISKKENLLGF